MIIAQTFFCLSQVRFPLIKDEKSAEKEKKLFQRSLIDKSNAKVLFIFHKKEKRDIIKHAVVIGHFMIILEFLFDSFHLFMNV